MINHLQYQIKSHPQYKNFGFMRIGSTSTALTLLGNIIPADKHTEREYANFLEHLLKAHQLRHWVGESGGIMIDVNFDCLPDALSRMTSSAADEVINVFKYDYKHYRNFAFKGDGNNTLILHNDVEMDLINGTQEETSFRQHLLREYGIVTDFENTEAKRIFVYTPLHEIVNKISLVNKEVLTPQKKQNEYVGKYRFRPSDAGAAILQVMLFGKYVDITADNCHFLGSVSLYTHLKDRYGIYLVCNDHTGLFEAFELINHLFTNYPYELILNKLQPKMER